MMLPWNAGSREFQIFRESGKSSKIKCDVITCHHDVRVFRFHQIFLPFLASGRIAISIVFLVPDFYQVLYMTYSIDQRF